MLGLSVSYPTHKVARCEGLGEIRRCKDKQLFSYPAMFFLIFSIELLPSEQIHSAAWSGRFCERVRVFQKSVAHFGEYLYL